MATFSRFESETATGTLEWALSTYGDEFAIATSFQKESMAILDMASTLRSSPRVFSLDTGRLPEETYGMIEKVRRRYGITVEMVAPDAGEVEQMVQLHGLDLFRQSVEFRTLCCDIRKSRPLERKLRELRAWATGLRRGQSATRASVAKVEEVDGRIRISPLADWTAAEVDVYLKEHDVPVHPLYARGYTSIGCAPCTRAIEPGEDERAGRWWWEDNAHKECGIHFSPDGTARRA